MIVKLDCAQCAAVLLAPTPSSLFFWKQQDARFISNHRIIVEIVLLIVLIRFLAAVSPLGKLRREDGCALLQTMMDTFVFVGVSKNEAHSFVDSSERLYQFSDPRIYKVASLRRRLNLKRVGEINARLGYKAKYPVILIPGVISSALDVWMSEEKPEWSQQRIWLSMGKIGYKFRNGGDRDEILSFSDFSISESEELTRRNAVRDWVKHITPREDGWSDPPGIKVRAHQGFGGLDYMADNFLKKASFIFGKLIANLIDVGYEPKSMVAAPYDWRLPPCKLQERDKYFSWLKIQTELLARTNKEKVVLISHSMGCRVVSYFLEWIKATVPNAQEWIDSNIHAWMPLGAPLLGAPVSMRSMLIGDTLGLDIFLHTHEGIQLARHLGSLPWLFPLKEDFLADKIVRVRSDPGSATSSTFKTLTPQEAMATYAPRTNRFWNDYFAKDPYFHQQQAINPLALNRPDADLPPVLRVPSVKNVWSIFGTNVQTESSYFFRTSTTTRTDSVLLELDPAASEAGSEYDPVWNPTGLKIENGVGFETEMTSQPAYDGRCVSGDGTVPYSSLAFAHKWKAMAEIASQNGFTSPNVEVTEVRGAQHRLMLNNDAVLDLVIKYICSPPDGVFV